MARQFKANDTSLWVDRYGDGSDGSLTISGNTTYSPYYQGCSGTSGGTSLTIDSASLFANGDLVILHQTRGSGAGAWELNKIASGAGTTSLTMAYPLQNTYTDSGNNQAQIYEMRQYTDVTINSGITAGAPAWDGSRGGIFGLFATGIITVTGTISTVSAGFRNNALTGGLAQGEGSAGAPSYSTSANGNGGGGGGNATDSGHVEGGNSGGGGSLNAGGNGNARNTGAGGTGGSAVGASTLTTFTLGGASGYGGNGWNQSNALSGVTGAGCVVLIGKIITVTGSINLNGNTGQSSSSIAATGGSGAGTCLIKGQTIDIGTNKISAAGGTGGVCTGSFGGSGGNGGAGGTHVDYSGSLTGTTTQTLSSSVDAVLAELPALDSYGFFM